MPGRRVVCYATTMRSCLLAIAPNTVQGQASLGELNDHLVQFGFNSGDMRVDEDSLCLLSEHDIPRSFATGGSALGGDFRGVPLNPRSPHNLTCASADDDADGRK